MNWHQNHHQLNRAPITLLTRRGALRLSLGAALGTLLGDSSSANDPASPPPSDKSIILFWLEGGPYQYDSFDPKENITDLATKFKPMSTAQPGVQFAECLPNLAKQARDIAVIRSMVAKEMEHSLAQYHAITGWRNTGIIQAPAIGSIVAHELGPRTGSDGLPSYVSIAHPSYPAGYFGPAYLPVHVPDPNHQPQNLNLPSSVSGKDFQRRLQLLASVEAPNRDRPFAKEFKDGRKGAVAFMNSKDRVAFDLNKEPAKLRDEYGRHRTGQGALLARRLVEAGTRFVQIRQPGYDTHANHYPSQENLLRELDQAMARLIVDLKDRGLLEQTVVVAAGEFGRTPKMNPNKGTDHWINGYSVAMAGGGFQGGAIYGSTTKSGSGVGNNPTRIADFMATLLHAVGIAPDREYHDDFDRPIKLVDEGKVVRELLA